MGEVPSPTSVSFPQNGIRPLKHTYNHPYAHTHTHAEDLCSRENVPSSRSAHPHRSWEPRPLPPRGGPSSCWETTENDTMETN